jgi:hypothetical protein
MANLIVNDKSFILVDRFESCLVSLGYKTTQVKQGRLPEKLLVVYDNIETIKKDSLLSTFIMCDLENEYVSVEEIYRDEKHIIYYSKFLNQFCGVAI